MGLKIAVVDDERNICRSIEACLVAEGFEVQCFRTASEAFEGICDQYFALAIIDIRLGKESGIELYKKLKSRRFDPPTLFISGNSSLSEAVDTVRRGAYDFLEKPFSPEKLIVTVRNCLAYFSMKRKVQQAAEQGLGSIIGEHATITTLKREISRVSGSDVSVLVRGESGCGKELVAESIHDQSKRKQQIFTKVNCSAIPEGLVESALFGHVKGAFTGATSVKRGFFEVSNGGTLFLDEIGDMPLAAQASLLRVLESSEVQKVGSDRISKVDVRVICASHKDLKQQVAEGQFREDLFYRISVVPVDVPPLRDRASDVELLAKHFVHHICQKHGVPEKSFTQECLKRMSSYPWPGNVRELRNAMERMVILGGDRLTEEDLPAEILRPSDVPIQDQGLTLKEFRQKMEKQYILKKIEECGGNISKVAKLLDVDRTHLYKKMALYGIQRIQGFQ